MHPQEEGSIPRPRQPGQGQPDGVVGTSFEVTAAVRFARGQAIVVDVEALIEPGAALEDDIADEGGGVVARPPERLGQRCHPRESRRAIVRPHRVLADVA